MEQTLRQTDEKQGQVRIGVEKQEDLDLEEDEKQEKADQEQEEQVEEEHMMRLSTGEETENL